MLLQAELGARRAGNGNTRNSLVTVVAAVNEAISSVRALTRIAAPLYSVGGSLGGALAQIGTLLSGDPAVSIEIDPEFDGSDLAETTADHLYRIALEALRNARRHARCRNLRLTLRVDAGVLELAVIDDGVGFDPAATLLKSFGLRLIDYRARVIGAALSLRSRPGQGTRVVVRMPLSICTTR
jgi:signal transduction histidine kinase